MVGGSRLSHQSGDIGANQRELLHDDKKQDLKSNLTTLDENCRELAARVVFGEQTRKGKVRIFEEDEEERRNRVLAKMLLRAALEDEEDDEYKVIEEDQKSLSVGIIGAPNAGKSTLTNFMVRGFTDSNYTQLTELYDKYKDKGWSRAFLGEFRAAQVVQHPSVRPPLQDARWAPQALRLVKLNTDAAVSGPRKLVGAGAVLRNHLGQRLMHTQLLI
ncbi:hypothetical protein JRO89_XS07G0157700 [Xanthoceras sorbifolium]|uniref:G domain-containing protein n=1 Tax=Xanthoceras sorbifolium TaxID=99658 RepID=A0ABQ8HU89_9ROSI|nr:hypothetical protein JRO89_XS07G0157700 [Xanthoceras sorbifolium]